MYAVVLFPGGITTSTPINVKCLLMEDVMAIRITLTQEMSVKETVPQIPAKKVCTCTCMHFLYTYSERDMRKTLAFWLVF